MDANASFTPEAITALINWTPGDFVGFQFAFEQPEGAHGGVHLILGGDLAGQCPINAPANCTPGPTWSANEPMFWLHCHATVDKVWYDWQHKNAPIFGLTRVGRSKISRVFKLYTITQTGCHPNYPSTLRCLRTACSRRRLSVT